MPARETSLGGPSRGFQPTAWTLLGRAKSRRPADAREALDELLRAYWKPVYLFLRRKGHAIEAAKDLTQAFFAQALERGLFARASRSRGRFRTLLLTALENFVRDAHAAEAAGKRGGGWKRTALDSAEAERALAERHAEDDPAEAFHRAWALGTVEAALGRLQRDAPPADFAILRAVLDGATYRQAARRTGRAEGTVGRVVHDLRGRLRRIVAEVSGEADVEELLRWAAR